MKRRKHVDIYAAAAIGILVCIVGCLLWSRFHSDSIPKLYFFGNIESMYEKSDVRKIFVTYVDGDRSFKGFAHLKVQGTSSLAYDKKNYTIKLYEDIDGTQKMPVDVGWGDQNKYCLKANWIDRTHARNVVTAKLASQVQEKYGLLTQAPCNGLVDGFPIEIYSNGEFLGLYTFNIPKSDWQFGMDSDNPNHIVLCGEDWEPANLFYGEPDFSTWAVEVGEENDETLEKARVLFDFVMNSSDKEFRADFEKHLSLDAALNYYIICDLAYMRDNLGKNMLLATYDGVKWYPSLYDLDTSWGTDWRGETLYDYGENSLNMYYNLLFARIEQCFPRKLAQRYRELRRGILSDKRIMKEFESFRKQIPEESFAKEAQKWGGGDREALPGFDYNQIEEYLNTISDRLNDKYKHFHYGL